MEPAPGAAIGDRVMVEGFEGERDAVLNPKKRVFETVQPDLVTDEQLRACFRGVALTTAAGPCTVKSLAGASIK